MSISSNLMGLVHVVSLPALYRTRHTLLSIILTENDKNNFIIGLKHSKTDMNVLLCKLHICVFGRI